MIAHVNSRKGLCKHQLFQVLTKSNVKGCTYRCEKRKSCLGPRWLLPDAHGVRRLGPGAVNISFTPNWQVAEPNMLRVRTNASHGCPLLFRNFYNKQFGRFEVLRLETSDLG